MTSIGITPILEAHYFPGHGAPRGFPPCDHQRPLEKMVLFWHQVFATGQSKSITGTNSSQADMLTRRHGDYRSCGRTGQNPAMIYWLDNCDNLAMRSTKIGGGAAQLFSMGVGGYTETVREPPRAFTSWTIAQAPPRGYHNRWDWEFSTSKKITMMRKTFSAIRTASMARHYRHRRTATNLSPLYRPVQLLRRR